MTRAEIATQVFRINNKILMLDILWKTMQEILDNPESTDKQIDKANDKIADIIETRGELIIKRNELTAQAQKENENETNF